MRIITSQIDRIIRQSLRRFAAPIDPTDGIYDSLEEARAYANNPKEFPYVGQLLKVKNSGNSPLVYIINNDFTLSLFTGEGISGGTDPADLERISALEAAVPVARSIADLAAVKAATAGERAELGINLANDAQTAIADLQGLEGIPGADGKSAYEIAVANGFEGTEQEWLDSITTIEITAYSAWQNWQDIDPINNTLSFNDWAGQHLQNYPFSSDEIERIEAKLAWKAATVDIEYWTGDYWINGKKIYGKIINFGALPIANSIKLVPHNISSIIEPIKIEGIATSLLYDHTIIFPNISTNSFSDNVVLDMAPQTTLRIRTGGFNWSSFNAIIIMYYTKV